MDGDRAVVEEQGRVALQRGDLAGAEEAFGQLASAPGARAAGDYGLALVADRRGQRVEATTLMQRVVAAEPRHANALFYLGLWTKADDPATAAAYLRRCLEVLPSHAGARSQLGLIAREAGSGAAHFSAPEPSPADRGAAPRTSDGGRSGVPTSAIPTTTIPTSLPPNAYRPSTSRPSELAPSGDAWRSGAAADDGSATDQPLASNPPLRPPRPPSSWSNLVGFVVELSERAEGRNETAFGLRAYEFVIQGVDESGRKTALESVEMRGAGRVGVISKGHWVEVDRGRIGGRTAATVNRLRNLTTGSDVSVRGVWSSASGRRGYYVVVPLFVVALMAGGLWWLAAKGRDVASGAGFHAVTVPDVTGERPTEAVRRLKSAGFTLVQTRVDANPASTARKGTVEETEPPAGVATLTSYGVVIVVAGQRSAGVPSGGPTSTPGSSGSAGHGSAGSSHTAAPSHSTTHSTTHSPTTTAALADCTDAQVQASEGRRLGTNGVVLLFANVSGSRCVLAGYPGVQLRGAADGPDVDARRTLRGPLGGLAPGVGTYRRLVLAPGAVASALLESTLPSPAPPITPPGPPTQSSSPTVTTSTAPISATVTSAPEPALTVVEVAESACSAFAQIAVTVPNTSHTTVLTPGLTGCSPTIHPVVAGANGE